MWQHSGHSRRSAVYMTVPEDQVRTGRKKPEERLGCDVILVAIGQEIDSAHFEESNVPVKRHRIVADELGQFREKKESSPAEIVYPVHLP